MTIKFEVSLHFWGIWPTVCHGFMPPQVKTKTKTSTNLTKTASAPLNFLLSKLHHDPTAQIQLVCRYKKSPGSGRNGKNRFLVYYHHFH